jgi:hypothetical protein
VIDKYGVPSGTPSREKFALLTRDVRDDTHIKTIVEIPGSRLEQAKRVASQERTGAKPLMD